MVVTVAWLREKQMAISWDIRDEVRAMDGIGKWGGVTYDKTQHYQIRL